MSLLSASQLSSIRKVGESGMITPVTIHHQVVDLGLDQDDDPYGSTLTYNTTTTTTVNGWLVGTWQQNRGATQGADLDTVTIYHLRLPVGTEISAGDEVVIGGNPYLVADAGTDATWPEWLVCTLRRAK